MNLYDIDKSLLDLVDPETGEITDIDAFNSLKMAKNDKIEQLGLWVKDLMAEAAALKAEKQAFADRQSRAEHKAESIKKYLTTVLAGAKFKTDRLDIAFRVSHSLEYDGKTDVPEQFLKYADPTIDKAEIKKEITNGHKIAGFTIVDSQNIQIK